MKYFKIVSRGSGQVVLVGPAESSYAANEIRAKKRKSDANYAVREITKAEYLDFVAQKTRDWSSKK